ncbi:hypothetical protein [uncultured Tyzzerella sp.]|uniref:hypothetical protein n=1 Tax=uncultured Tyzzerella sp. TaxID=2321398 RepID=UPI0029430CED|nr:hypothetical protein [uncultured Tyzzerella sp.]
MAIDKNKKDLASEIMRLKGIDHDEWLNNSYQNFITDNAKFLIEKLRENDTNSELN